MATAYGRIGYSIIDGLGVTASHVDYVSIDDTKTIANMRTFMDSYLDQIEAISGGHITTAEICVVEDTSGRAAAAATSRVEQTALFNFSQAGSPYKYGVDIPAIDNSFIVAGHIDLADAAISAFIAFMEAAHTGFQIVSKYRAVLNALLDAAITFRKKRRALARVSTEPGS